MTLLSEEEHACLLGVAAGKTRSDADCRPGVLLRLLKRGLVLQRPQRSLPLENCAHDYVLSLAGQQLLERQRQRR